MGVRAVVEGLGSYLRGAGQVNTAQAGMAKSADAVTASSARASVSLRVMGERLSTIGRDMALVGAALLGPAVAAGKFASGFESSITRIETLVGINRATLNDWQDDVLAIAGKTAKAPIELSEALFTVTSAGLRGAEALEVLDQAAKAGAIGLGNTKATAQTVTAALQAYGTENLSAARATNILVATVREGNLAAEQLAPVLGRVLGPAATLGIRFEDLGAFIATYTRLGGSAAEATTSLNSVMTTFLKPTKGAQEALESVGLEMADLRRQAGEEGVAQALFTLLDAFEGNDEMLASVIPNIRALRGVLATAGVQSEEFIKIQNAIRGELNLVEEGFATVSETASFKFSKALNDIRVELTAVGSEVLPVLITMIGVFSEAAGLFGKLPEPVKAATISVLALAGAMTLLGGVSAIVVGNLLRLAPALGFVNLQILRLRIAMIGLNATILANPLAWAAVAVAVAVAVGAYVLLRDTSDEVNESLRTQLDILRELEGVSVEAAQRELEESERALTKAAAERIKVERELLDLAKEQIEVGGFAPEDERAKRLEALGGALSELRDAEEEATAARDDSRASLTLLLGILDRSEGPQRALVERLREDRDALIQQQNALDGVALMRERGIPLLAKEQAEYDALTVAIDDVNDDLEEEERALDLVVTSVDKLSDAVAGPSGLIKGFEQFEITAEANRKAINKLQGAYNDTVVLSASLSAQTIATAEAIRLMNIAMSGADLVVFDQAFDDAIARIQKFGSEAARTSEIAKELLALAGIGGAGGFTPGARFDDPTAPEGETPEEAAARARREAIDDVNALGALIETALRRQADAQLEIVRGRIEAETQLAREGAADRIKILREEADAAIAELDRVTDARVAELEAQLGIISEDRTAEERAALERRLALAFDANERAEIEAEIREFERRQSEKAIREQIADVRAAARDESEAIRKESDRRIKAIEKERDARLKDLRDEEKAAQDAYAAATDAFTLESEARRLLAEEEFAAISKLLTDFVPEWTTAGFDYGRGLLEGLQNSGVEAFIDGLLSKMNALGAPRSPGAGVPAPAPGGSGVPNASGGTSNVAAINAQGEALLAGGGLGALDLVLDDLRALVEAAGGVPTFRRGGVMPHTGLAHLERGEIVINPALSGGGGGGGTTVQRGAFEGMFRGASFGGSPRENMREARRQFESMLDEHLTRGAFMAGEA